MTSKPHYFAISGQIVNGVIIGWDTARIYIELYSSLLIHKVVDGDEGRIYSLSSARQRRKRKDPLLPLSPHPSALSLSHERAIDDSSLNHSSLLGGSQEVSKSSRR